MSLFSRSREDELDWAQNQPLPYAEFHHGHLRLWSPVPGRERGLAIWAPLEPGQKNYVDHCIGRAVLNHDLALENRDSLLQKAAAIYSELED